MLSLAYTAHAAGTNLAPHGQLKVMFMVQGPGQERSQSVENVLTQAFMRQGYQVIDAATVAQALRRNADLLKQAESEAAKRLGSGLGADIVVSGETKGRIVDKTYTLLEGRKVMVSQAHVSVKAVLARTGKVLVAEHGLARKPFDTTGAIAFQMAAESVAALLLQGLDEVLNRDTIDYQLVVMNINDSQSLTLQDGLRTRLQGIRQINAHRFAHRVLELDVSVAKDLDLAFKQGLVAQLSGLGLGRFEVVAREGESIYLRKVSASMATQPKLSSPPPGQSADRPSVSPRPPEGQSRQAPAEAPQVSPPPPTPVVGSTTYNPGYRKS